MGEKLKGTAKVAAGKATGDEDLERQCQAQQKKADEAACLEEKAEHKRNQQNCHEGEQTKHRD